jgi:cytochrome c oxidase subunit 3
MVVCLLFSLAFLVCACFEFGASTRAGTPTPTARWCGCCWPAHDPPDHRRLRFRRADGADFTGPLEGKRFVDVSENALYWYFVVLSWLPIYAVLYLAPRL